MATPLLRITYRRAVIFACFLVLYEFLTYIANDMIMPAMIFVVDEFHAPETAIARSLSTYILGGASLQLLLGPLSDRYGRRPVMLCGAVLFCVFTVALAFTHSINWFLILRCFEGMGLCFISVVGYAVLQEMFDEMDAIRLIAVMASVAILAPLIGPLAGALFLHIFSWRFIFIFIGVGALFALWGLWRFMPESIGAQLRDGTYIQSTPFTVRVVMKNYLRLLGHSSVLCGGIAYGLLAIPCVAWIALSPKMLVQDAHYSLLDYGLWQLPIFGSFVVGNITLSKLSRHFTTGQLINFGACLTVLGLFAMLVLPLIHTGGAICLIPGLMLYSFGYSVVATPMNRWILFSNNVGKGTVSGFICVLSMLLQALGIEVINELYTRDQVVLFGVYCFAIGILYSVFLFVARKYTPSHAAI